MMRALSVERKDSRTEVYKKCLLNPAALLFLSFRLASCTLSKASAEPTLQSRRMSREPPCVDPDGPVGVFPGRAMARPTTRLSGGARR